MRSAAPARRRARRPARPRRHGPANGARQALDRREQSERAFLALCVALPELGESEARRGRPRRPLHLAADPRSPPSASAATCGTPAAILAERRRELAELVPEIVLRAGQLDATPATLELEALQLDLHRLDREIIAARAAGDGPSVRALATERQRVLDAIRHRLHVEPNSVRHTN